MGKYIKSYSNYVLKKKHQTVNDGVIYERDITTIGGRDQFAKGQIPIYRSGNFIITTNNDNTFYKKTSTSKWEKNDTGDDIWTIDVLNDYEKDEKSSFDEKIIIKKDYYDLRDFAYYGSCSELIRSSINNILKTYPGELFIPVFKVWIIDGIRFYTEEAAISYSGEDDVEKYIAFAPLNEKYTDTKGVIDDDGNFIIEPGTKRVFELPSDVDNGKLANLFAISNPFNINVHSDVLPIGADFLKYFAEEGYKNYVAYRYVDGEWDYDNPLIVKPEIFEPYDTSNDPRCPGDYLGKIKICFYNPAIKMSVEPQSISVCEDCDGKLENTIHIEFEKTDEVEASESIEKIFEKCLDGNKIVEFNTSSPEFVDCITVYVFIGDNGEIKYFVDLADININEHECDSEKIMPINISIDINDEWKYRIRPNQKIINEYYDNLDIFERILLDDGNSFKSFFDVINENDYGYFSKIEKFKFPTTYGGYNLGGNGMIFSKFLKRLVEIGEFYDERFSDNLWRSMTHESIKNFDWTYNRHYTPGEEEPYVEGGSKIQKIIRVYGREFDEIKGYIDAISDTNTITYDDASNLPDYFFTDKLEDDGWDVKLINPIKLVEYVNGEKVDIPKDVKEKAELSNEYNCKKINRLFSSDFSIQNIKPYSADRIESVRKTDCNKVDTIKISYLGGNCDTVITEPQETICDSNGNLIVQANMANTGSKTVEFEGEVVQNSKYNTDVSLHIDFEDSLSECVNCDSNGEYDLVAEIGESQKEAYHDNCCNLVKIYSSEREYKMSDINSEFLKRFILNSKEILRHKGTIEGIEMLLSLFGLRSKNYALTNETYFKQDGTQTLTNVGKKYYKKKNINTKQIYDYDIKEYTLFTTRIEDYYDANKKMYHYDWINSIKLNLNNNYYPYKGLPVSYRESEKTRFLYPSFQKDVVYDGNPYYQMNGGWLSKKPIMFDVNDNIITTGFNKDNLKSNTLFTETIKNIKCVQTIKELVSNKSLAINNGDICQVIDLSGKFAIVDGTVYDLFDETDNVSYFYVTIENNALVVGNALFTDYVYVSNPYAIDGKKRYDLSDDTNNGRDIKIYVIKENDGNYNIDVHSNSNSITTFTVFENGKYMKGDNFTNYFRINNPNFFNELSVIGWQQLKDNEYEYYIMNSIVDNNKGNNPHTGHMNYDNGHEYLTYFAKLFKHSYNNSNFDEREIEEDENVYEDVIDYGFKNLINDENDCDKNYDEYLKEDTKCHYFGDLITSTNKYVSYDEENNKPKQYSYSIPEVIRKPILSFDSVDIQKYGDGVEGDIDGITNQIVNTKRIEIDFYINNGIMYSNEWLEEVKYIDSVILPYLTQMLPSTIICSINYKQSNICK